MVDRASIRFRANLESGNAIYVKYAVLATGFKYFAHCLRELMERLPSRSFKYTSDLVELGSLRGRRCLIIGGKQSACEWAALLAKAGAAAIHISHRHAGPRSTETDWSWANLFIQRIYQTPGWYRRL